MLKNLLKLEGVKLLDKNQQKGIKGGEACCNPSEECCGGGCSGCPAGQCQCTSGCTYCRRSGAGFCGCL